jgi:phosphoglycolate phosphatase
MQLRHRSKANIGGDSTEFSKPHPAPVLKAAELTNLDPKTCLYVGDDLRDIEAGRAAGMKTVAASYGYCGCTEPIQSWGADFIISHPLDLRQIIFKSST